MYNKQTLAVILGGGRGERLAPLTMARCKPAINLAGKFRLIDIPVSNCINSNIMKIFVATQFLSTGLHRHLFETYRFDRFSQGFIQVLAAEQTPTNMDWFQGTADAIRQCLRYIIEWNIKYVLILSGDQLYSMNYNDLIEFHVKSKADITVSTLPVPAEDVYRMGIMRIDNGGRITDFVEKPQEPEVREELATDESSMEQYGVEAKGRRHLGSMGVYVFNRNVLVQMLKDEKYTDFGRELIPDAVDTCRVFGYVYDDFWEDIGTIESYYRVNLSLTDPKPPFDFYREDWPIYTRPRSLPGVRVVGGRVEKALLCEGCIVDNSEIIRSIIGIRQMIRSGSSVRNSLVLGADFYDTGESTDAFRKARSDIPLGIGHNVQIDGAIIDKNTRIGDGAVIRPKHGEPDQDYDGYVVRSGIVIVPRGQVIEPGRVI